MVTITDFDAAAKSKVATAMHAAMEVIVKCDQQLGMMEIVKEKQEIAFVQSYTRSDVEPFKPAQPLIDSLLMRGDFAGGKPTAPEIKALATVKDKPAELWQYLKDCVAAVATKAGKEEQVAFFSFCLSLARDVAAKGREGKGVVANNVTADEFLALGKMALEMGLPMTKMSKLKGFEKVQADAKVHESTPYGDDGTALGDRTVGELPFNPFEVKPNEWIP